MFDYGSMFCLAAGGGFLLHLNPQQNILRGRAPVHGRVQPRLQKESQPYAEPESGRVTT